MPIEMQTRRERGTNTRKKKGASVTYIKCRYLRLRFFVVYSPEDGIIAEKLAELETDVYTLVVYTQTKDSKSIYTNGQAHEQDI